MPRQRILVVDDEALITRVLARALGTEHDVVTSNDGAHALQLVAQQEFDIVLVDMRLGDVWGGTFLESVAALRPHLRGRVAFLTGGVGEPEIDDFFARVPNERLAKPFRTADLHALIARIARRG